MGIKNERLHGVIRLSLSHLNTMDEMRTIVEVVKENVKKYGI
jgi:cysteine sulfinate desulfinase/cysteine desulfurase-like protein